MKCKVNMAKIRNPHRSGVRCGLNYKKLFTNAMMCWGNKKMRYIAEVAYRLRATPEADMIRSGLKSKRVFMRNLLNQSINLE